MTKLRWILVVLVSLGVLMLALRGARPRPEPPATVSTIAATRGDITRVVSGAGKLEPIRKVNVSSNITGVLLKLQVEIGSRVKIGDVLCQIDTSLYKTQVARQKAQVRSASADTSRARANLALQETEVARLEPLVAQGLVPAQDLERARAAVTLARAEIEGNLGRASSSEASLAEAKNALGWATIRAPIDGTVLAVNHRVGERIRGSDFSEDVILTIGSLNAVDVRLEVGEHDVVFIKPGQTAEVEIDAFPGQTFVGTVKESGRDAIVRNQGTENEVTTFPVWVTLNVPPERVLSGMSAQVQIQTETRANVVVVPIAAVTVRAPATGPASNAERPAVPPAPSAPPASNAPPVPTAQKGAARKPDKVVFVARDDKAVQRVVEVGLSSETHIEVVSGLAPDEVIVTGPYRTLARELQDGQAIDIEKSEPSDSPSKGGS